MNRSLVASFLVFLACLLVACGPDAGRFAPTASVSDPDLGQHLLVDLQGSLSYKHPGWKDYLPLSFGTALQRGDLLKAAEGASARVVCADLSLSTVPSGYVGALPCPEAQAVLRRGESLVIAPQRSMGQEDAIPYVLSPRRTFLLSDRPLLCWHATEGGSPYTVRLFGSDLDWTAGSPTAELSYFQDAPALEPGVPYRVEVTDALGRSSADEQTALDLSFALMAPQQVAEVDALLDRVQELDVSAQAAALLEAEIYAAYGLRAEAIARLESLSGLDELPSFLHRLAGYYLEVGLYSEARAAFERALAGYRAGGGRAGEAAALTGLGLAEQGDGDEAAARQSLEQARALYDALGDVEGLDEVDGLLMELGGG